MAELFAGRNPKGYTFVLEGNQDQIQAWVEDFLNYKEPENPDEDDYDDYSIRYCDKGTDGERFTQEERDQNVEELRKVWEGIQQNGWKDIFLNLPRKKDGSLYKNRIVKLWRGTTFQHFWEDSYGWNAPELSIKAIDNYRAVVELTSRVVGW